MSVYEYRVVPAPATGRKARGAKTPADRFAHALTDLMNDMAADGWEYVRAECLPSTERQGLMGRKTEQHNLLVFRRRTDTAEPAAPPLQVPAEPEAPAPRLGAPDPAEPADAPGVDPERTAATLTGLHADPSQRIGAPSQAGRMRLVKSDGDGQNGA